MQVRYIVRESFSGFARAKLSASAAVFTITVSLLLVSMFTVVFVNLQNIIEAMRDRVEMEAFLEDGISADTLRSIQATMLTVEGVESVTYISKDEAAKIFLKEFGEDIYKVLDFNPLPASFKIKMRDGFKNAQSAAAISEKISALTGVQEVIYRRALLEILDQRAKAFVAVALLVGVVIGISAIFLVSNTIRLAIYSKRRIIDTMKLIGATSMFVRFPFLIEGVVQGLIGGILASGLVYGFTYAIRRWISPTVLDIARVRPEYYGYIVLLGALLGLAGAFFSIRRFLSRTVEE